MPTGNASPLCFPAEVVRSTHTFGLDNKRLMLCLKNAKFKCVGFVKSLIIPWQEEIPPKGRGVGPRNERHAVVPTLDFPNDRLHKVVDVNGRPI